MTVNGNLTVCGVLSVIGWATSQKSVCPLFAIVGLQFKVPVTVYDLVPSVDTEVVVNSLVVNWLLPILIVIVGAGYPPVDVQVHVLCWLGAVLLVPTSVGVCGDATRKRFIEIWKVNNKKKMFWKSKLF